MNVLDIDLGNTRLKWRVRRAGRYLGQGAVVTDASGSWQEVFCRQVDEVAVPERIRVASVRDRQVTGQLDDAVRKCWSVTPEYARVSRECAGVSNSYTDVERMGVDRWLAMMAGFHHAGGACMVIGAGTALTVDIVSGSGQHEGGYIVPGMALMLESLQQRSSALVFDETDAGFSAEPGKNTAAAIMNGLASMVTGWLNTQCSRYPGHACLLTGGDADMMLPHIKKAEHVPSLVLDGLELALP